MKILLTGGGTGGHILPTLAVAAALKDKVADLELLYVGSNKESDREVVEAAGIPFRGIHSGKLRRYFHVKNISDIFKVVAGFSQAAKIMDTFKPDVVFAKGGYVTLPVIIAAGVRKIPVVAHESDSKLGLSNKLGLRWITKLATAFPVEEVAKHSPAIKNVRDGVVYTGLPVDAAMLTAIPSRPFANGKPILLVTGGSQGSSFINQIVVEALPELLEVVNVIHYTGHGDYPSITSYYRSLDPKWEGSYLVKGFDIEDFRSYLKSADLVLSRSGSFIFELEALGKVGILVPLPSSASNHQYENARFLEGLSAAMMVEQQELTPDKLIKVVSDLLADKDRYMAMASKMAELGSVHKAAADKLADLVVEEVR
jgi:UDP-N-acetylglucosamine--N-acetylmuramyl-(pentapeptide) pyrophosphoryl-undecaprenol N-acetylglucosamine transferase